MTKLLYLDNSFLFTGTAKVLDIKPHEKGTAIILDQTIFYPQGGGQPCDLGTITSGPITFNVIDVRLDPASHVWHIGDFTNQDQLLETGLEVELKIDQERRLKNMRCHSAGHLIDIAIGQQSALKDLVAGKGFHFPEGPYVEYIGEIENPRDYMESLEQTCRQLVDQDITIIAENLPAEEAQKRGIKAPPGKSARFVYFEGYENAGCGCGGTHTKNSGEIGPITIRKISSKKGVTRVAYQI